MRADISLFEGLMNSASSVSVFNSTQGNVVIRKRIVRNVRNGQSVLGGTLGDMLGGGPEARGMHTVTKPTKAQRMAMLESKLENTKAKLFQLKEQDPVRYQEEIDGLKWKAELTKNPMVKERLQAFISEFEPPAQPVQKRSWWRRIFGR